MRAIYLWPQWYLLSHDLRGSYPAVTSVTAVQLWPIKLWPQSWLSSCDLWSCDLSDSYPVVNLVRTFQLWLQWQLSSCDLSCCDLSDSYPVVTYEAVTSVTVIQLRTQWELSSCDFSDSYPVVTSVTVIQLRTQWELSSCDLSDSYPVVTSVTVIQLKTIQLWPQWQLSSCDLSDSYPVENSVRTIQLWPQWQLSSCDLSESCEAVTPVRVILRATSTSSATADSFSSFFHFFPCCLLTELYFRLTRWLQSIQLGPTTSTAPTMAWSVVRFLAYFHALYFKKIQDFLVCSDALCKDLCLCFTGGMFFNGEFSVLCSWIRLLQMKTDESYFVSWCFEPSQPQRVISGLTTSISFSNWQENLSFSTKLPQVPPLDICLEVEYMYLL